MRLRWNVLGLLASMPLALGCAAAPEPAAPRGLAMTLSVPAGTPADADVYVAGTFNGWDPAAERFRMTRRPDGRYGIALPRAVRGPIEFKFTLGAWDRVETAADGGDVPNRYLVVPDEAAPTWTGAVARWREATADRPSTAGPTVSVLSEAFAMPQLERERRVWVYLPPDYAASERRYPVLYMHDGQNVFDAATSYAGEWGVDESLDSLHALGDPGVIVVAVDHGGEHRFDEYSPWRHERHGGGLGDEYVDFLVHALKPYIDGRYRTRPERESTGVAGSSMGGLISLYAALEYPEVFGMAGVFSPALWVAPAAFEYARAAGCGPCPRFYFVSGGREVAQGEASGVYERDQERMLEALAHAGMDGESQVRARVRPDGQHSEWFWRQEFPAAYRWLFGRDSTAAGSNEMNEMKSKQE